jgi:hypothetical protein
LRNTVSPFIVEYWSHQLRLRSYIQEKGGFHQYFVHDLPEQAELAFNVPKGKKKGGCSDGRITRRQGQVRSAGSGILQIYDGKAVNRRGLVHLRRFYKANDTYRFTSHEYCGALRTLYLQQYGTAVPPSEERLWKEVNEFIPEAYTGMVKLLGSDWTYTAEDHIRSTIMKGDPKLHFESMLTYVAVPNFNTAVYASLFPESFVTTRYGRGRYNALRDVKTLCTIALSNEGYGKLITTKDPFQILIVTSADSGQFYQLPNLIKELQPVLAQFDGRVEIAQFLNSDKRMQYDAILAPSPHSAARQNILCA